MDLVDIRAGLGAAAAAVTGLNGYPSAPAMLAEPAFYPGETDIDYDQTYGGGVDQALVTCYLLTSFADDADGQALLDRFLGRGATSVKAALERDRTLGGRCSDLRVKSVRAYRTYQYGEDTYYGAQLQVFVIGQAEE
ncbi:hypothetical protein [Krasilnikovia sp. MM14-A1259]|uniref:hypothetical protein n=1 Tax=Krasilnikovia sp. MM14-A1259 TaxID=3373539 RepID=UPI0037F34661